MRSPIVAPTRSMVRFDRELPLWMLSGFDVQNVSPLIGTCRTRAPPTPESQGTRARAGRLPRRARWRGGPRSGERARHQKNTAGIRLSGDFWKLIDCVATGHIHRPLRPASRLADDPPHFVTEFWLQSSIVHTATASSLVPTITRPRRYRPSARWERSHNRKTQRIVIRARVHNPAAATTAT